MRLTSKYSIFISILYSTASCTFFGNRATTDNTIVKTSPSYSFLASKSLPCLGMVKEFCETLFSPENQGALLLTTDESTFRIRLGTTENDFNEKDYEFLKTRLKSWSRLPNDFREFLSGQGFREKLKRYLNRTSRRAMEFKDRIDSLRDEEEINSIWKLAYRKTVLTRMEGQYFGFSKIKEDFIPLELKYENERLRRQLSAELSLALWKKHENWLKVEAIFEKVRAAYVRVIKGNPKLTDDIKQDWVERIYSIKLIIPGSDPEIDMGNCSRSESNAYYFTEKNVITVCAGDFNTEEIEQTIAHEIGHSLDLSRTRLLFQERTSIGQKLLQLKNMSCKKAAFSCENWNDTKEKFISYLGASEEFKPQLREFNSCLKGKTTKAPIEDAYISRVARESVDVTLSDLAERNVFLRVISPKLPLPDGSSHRNPMYLNPCGYYLWDTQVHPLDEEVGLLLFFTAEYRCSNATDKELKFRNSIEKAKEMQTALIKTWIRIEGEYSDRERLNLDGYAASPDERFADSLGQVVFSQILKEDQNVKKRRARYLANNAWLCRRPSIQQLFPAEAMIQKSYYVESHSDTTQRQKELLTKDIREVLQCSDDVGGRQCSL